MALKGTVHYETRGQVALLTIDNPPVNPLSSGVRQGIYDGVVKALGDATIKAIVLTGAGRAFIAGADISEFGGPGTGGASLGDALKMMEDSDKPVIAAINGTAFGGGLEVALCCDYRVASPSAPVGLPEVKLGLLPGAGGTQRLPRLVGAQKALDFILSGDPIPAPQAKVLGIVDEVIEGDIVTGAIAFANDVVAKGAKKRRIRDEPASEADRGNAQLFADARKKAASTMRGRFAPEMIIRCVEAAVNEGDFERGMKVEAECFGQCLRHPQREALIHVFFAERECAKVPGLDREAKLRPINKAAVIGCGTMGGGIAMCFANAGIPVTVLEMEQKAIDRGMGVIRKNYERMVERGRMSAGDLDNRMALFSTTLDYAALGDADVVIEAVYENIDVKVEVFKKLETVMKKGAIIASNTSGLDIDKMANATSRPEDVIGLHFFSPANVMRLLEVVRGTKSSDSTIATSMNLGKTLRKIAVLSGNSPGFIGNRILGAYTRQASEIILQGATPYQVDSVIGKFGMPMGPFQMNDLVGLDLFWRVRKLQGMKSEDVPLLQRVADRLAEMERWGQKNGRGFYIYGANSRAGTPDPEVVALVEQVSAEAGITRRPIDDDEVLRRCVYAMVNEACKVLEEKVAIRASDIDITYLNGYGFPEVTGGPMFWAEKKGLANVLADIKKFHAEYGDAWKPAPLLERMVAENLKFADLGK